MADKRITELVSLDGAGLDADRDVLAIADVSAAETKKITAQALLEKTLTTIPPGTIDGDVIVDGSISGLKLEEDSVTSRELAPDSVDTIHVVDGAITNDKLANGINGGKLDDGSVTGPKIAAGAIGTDHLIDQSVTNEKLADGIDGSKLLDGSVSGSKLEAGSVGEAAIVDRSLPGIKLQLNTLTADEIGPNAVGNSELQDDAVGTNELQDDACSTPKYKDLSVTNEKLASGIDGSKLVDGSVDASKLSGGISSDQIDSIGLDKLPNAAANTVLAGPETGGAVTSAFRRLVGSDLPVATDSTLGGVSAPASGGLNVSGVGALGIANSVAPGTNPVVTYDAHGLITSGRALQSSDLPAAQPGAIGGVKAGDGITITPDGTLSQSTTGVVAGTYPKVTVDERGNVTAGMALEADDIPALNINDLNGTLDLSDTTGSLDGQRLLDKSVTRRKLADYAITFIQEATPVVDATVHVGCLWFRESTAGLNMWNGNSWMNIGQGRLSAENLRYCGIIDATTGLITGLTQFGVGEGFTIGDPIPVPTDERTGVYFVVEIPGSGITQTPGVTYDAGDWCLCNGSAAGWVRIDTLNGGGGGGGAQRLNDLLDVDVTGAAEGAMLQLQASGMWTDIQIVDAGDY